jgi:ABC-type nitrate/sulfonate/bicarbonate transport system permease component
VTVITETVAAGTRVSKTTQTRRRVRQVVVPLLVLLVVLAAWELLPRLGVVRSTVLPPLSTVIPILPSLWVDSAFVSSLGASAIRWSVGLILAIVIGIPLGLVMARSRTTFAFVNPLMVLTYSVPKAALVLIFTLWFGVGLLSSSLVIAIGCGTPLIISAYHGAKGINTHLVWSAWALGTSRHDILRRVVFPAALPEILAGLRTALQLSLFILLASEFLIRQTGIGAYMFNNLDVGQYPTVWAIMVTVATIGVLLDLLYVRLVRICVPWLEGEV